MAGLPVLSCVVVWLRFRVNIALHWPNLHPFGEPTLPFPRPPQPETHDGPDTEFSQLSKISPLLVTKRTNIATRMDQSSQGEDFMNKQSKPVALQQAPTSVGTHAGYMPGFGNDFETEALPVPCLKG